MNDLKEKERKAIEALRILHLTASTYWMFNSLSTGKPHK
jgi:hypothetical protein